MSKPSDVVNFRKRIKQALVEGFNGICQNCKQFYPVAVFDFHHLDSATKSFGLGNASTTRSRAAYAEEAKKCCMLCANCHRLVEYEYEDTSFLQANFDEKKYYEKLEMLTNINHNPNLQNGEYFCPNCGKKISNGAKKCADCSYEERRVVTRPNREELKYLIRHFPMTQIGKKYGVADNSIRKWCDKYGLPRKKTEISKYTDEEWELI